MIEDPRFIRTEPPKSPLDPFLCQFLRAIEAMSNGYLPSVDRHAIITTLGWQADFADAIQTSAQARGLIERVPVGQGRRRMIWRVSTRGRNWLEMGDRGNTVMVDPDRELSVSQPMM